MGHVDNPGVCHRRRIVRRKLTQPNRRTLPSGSVTNDFKLGRAVGTSEQGIDPGHNGIFDQILATRFTLQDWQLLQDHDALL
jgi:hypothetical protein